LHRCSRGDTVQAVLSKFLKEIKKSYTLGCAPVYIKNEIVYTVIHQPQGVFPPFLHAFVDISAFHIFYLLNKGCLQ
jgi:hypothetical protein